MCIEVYWLSMNNKFRFSSWNLRGMGHPFWGRSLRKWVNYFQKDLSIICLQELKAKEEKQDFQLCTLFPHRKFTMDYAKKGKVGVVVGVLSDLCIINKGTKGDDCFVWVIVVTTVGLVSIGLVYALNERTKRIALWVWMATRLHEGEIGILKETGI